MREPGRNDPCPCGSGLKYKRCCLLKAANPFVVPTLVTTTGDALAFVKAVWDVRDEPRLRTGLNESEELDAESDRRFVWLEGTGDMRRVLGTFDLSPGRLTLETMSESRAERAQEFIERIASGATMFRVTRVEDAAQALGARARLPMGRALRAPPSEMPPEMETTIVLRMLDKHYREWLDVPVPALGNRTPRHAARLKTVRPALIALLESFEDSSEQDRLDGRPAYDFAWMWKELGLERPTENAPPQAADSPAERVTALVTAGNHDKAREMMREIRGDLDTTPNPAPWLAAARDLEAQRIIDFDTRCYFSEIFLECLVFEAMDTDPNLTRLDRERIAIEHAHGLGEDEFWLVGEEPPEWLALNDAWNARVDALTNGMLRRLGYSDVADLRERDPDVFEQRCERGRAGLFGPIEA